MFADFFQHLWNRQKCRVDDDHILRGFSWRNRTIFIALITLGRKVPDDVSVIGITDIQLAHQVHPALTTVAIQTAAIAELSVDAGNGGKLSMRQAGRIGAEVVGGKGADPLRAFALSTVQPGRFLGSRSPSG